MYVVNFVDGVVGDFFDINLCVGGDFVVYQYYVGFDIGFICDMCFWILFEDCIQYGIGDLVSNFVRMFF